MTKVEKLDLLVKITNIFNYIGLVVMFVLPCFISIEGIVGSTIIYAAIGVILGLLLKEQEFNKTIFLWLPSLAHQKIHNKIFK